MGQEYFINSQTLETKIRQLLPSQGGAGAGFDLSASTQIIPVIDVTESAEGSELRADLQSSLSHNTITTNEIANANTVVLNTTGYYRIFGSANFRASGRIYFEVNDGVTGKIFLDFDNTQSITANIKQFDFLLKLDAGDSLSVVSTNANAICRITTRQIADITGVLQNP